MGEITQPCKGLTLKRNSAGHRVVLLHYSADPEKDPETKEGREWVSRERAEIMADLNPGKWRAEYEIDFSVSGGDLVFPTFMRDKKDIVVSSFNSTSATCYYGGLDWGIQNNTAFVIVAAQPDRSFTTIFEKTWKKAVPVVVAEEIKNHPLYEDLQFIACDPAIQSHLVVTASGHTTVAELLSSEIHAGRHALKKLMPAHGRSDEVCINLIRNLWVGEKKKYQILESCSNIIDEIAALEHEESRGDKNLKEKIKDRNNHSWDAQKYILLSHPDIGAAPTKRLDKNTVAYLDAVTQVASDLAAENGTSLQEEFNHTWGIDL